MQLRIVQVLLDALEDPFVGATRLQLYGFTEYSAMKSTFPTKFPVLYVHGRFGFEVIIRTGPRMLQKGRFPGISMNNQEEHAVLTNLFPVAT